MRPQRTGIHTSDNSTKATQFLSKVWLMPFDYFVNSIMVDFKSRFVGKQAYINKNGNIQDNQNELLLMKSPQISNPSAPQHSKFRLQSYDQTSARAE